MRGSSSEGHATVACGIWVLVTSGGGGLSIEISSDGSLMTICISLPVIAGNPLYAGQLPKK